jgi:hypothetical protein
MTGRDNTHRQFVAVYATTHDVVLWLEEPLSSSAGTWGSSEAMGEARVKKVSIASG